MAKMGAPRKEINPEQLKALMRLRPTLDMTAAFFEVSQDTVAKRIHEIAGPEITFTEFREQNLVHTRFSLIRKAITMAESGNVPMLIFSLKNLCGWADKQEVHQNFAEGTKETLTKMLAGALSSAEVPVAKPNTDANDTSV